MATVKSWNSPASRGAYDGPGEVEGAGELPARGPGPAAQRKIDAGMSSSRPDAKKTSGRGE